MLNRYMYHENTAYDGHANISWRFHSKRNTSCIVNTMAVDDLIAQRARATAAMVLTYFSWNMPVSVPEGLIEFIEGE